MSILLQDHQANVGGGPGNFISTRIFVIDSKTWSSLYNDTVTDSYIYIYISIHASNERMMDVAQAGFYLGHENRANND